MLPKGLKGMVSYEIEVRKFDDETFRFLKNTPPVVIGEGGAYFSLAKAN